MSDADTLRIQHAVDDACPPSGRPIAADARVIGGDLDRSALAFRGVETALQARRAANAGLDQ